MADDDRAVLERLAALEAEVAADTEALRARKAAAVAKLRDQRVTQTSEHPERAEREKPRTKNAEPAGKSSRRDRSAGDINDANDPSDAGSLEGLGGALELASKANRVKQELARTPKKGEKSWVRSGALSLTGPIGWLYAGSLREAVPATAAWIALLTFASKFLPWMLMMPVFMVVLPLSAIAGVVYALQYNRKGSRQRLFDGDKDKQKQLRGG